MIDIRLMVEYINGIHKAVGEETFTYVDRGHFYFIKKGEEKIAVIDFINYCDRVKRLLS